MCCLISKFFRRDDYFVFQGYYDNPKVCALYVMKGTLEGEWHAPSDDITVPPPVADWQAVFLRLVGNTSASHITVKTAFLYIKSTSGVSSPSNSSHLSLVDLVSFSLSQPSSYIGDVFPGGAVCLSGRELLTVVFFPALRLQTYRSCSHTPAWKSPRRRRKRRRKEARQARRAGRRSSRPAPSTGSNRAHGPPTRMQLTTAASCSPSWWRSGSSSRRSSASVGCEVPTGLQRGGVRGVDEERVEGGGENWDFTTEVPSTPAVQRRHSRGRRRHSASRTRTSAADRSSCQEKPPACSSRFSSSLKSEFVPWNAEVATLTSWPAFSRLLIVISAFSFPPKNVFVFTAACCCGDGSNKTVVFFVGFLR